jgi:hypothetical protein
MPRYEGFISGSNPSQSRIADSEQTMNLYVEPIASAGATAKAALYPSPGFRAQISTVADVNARALFDMRDRTFGVVGGSYVELFPLLRSATLRAAVAQDGRLAQIVSNGPAGQQLVSSGGNAYCHVLSSNVVTTVLTGDATQIGMLDTFFLAFNAVTGVVRISASNDGTTWDPTQIANRSAQPDPWRAMIVNAPDIWLFGEQLTDVWYDSGATPFPFVPRTGLSIPYGIGATSSIAISGGSLLWLARNKDGIGPVVQANGYQVTPISTPELNTTIAGYARTTGISDAEGLVYQEAGHVFYVLRFPAANATWAYDLTTKLWAERGKWNGALGQYDVWAPRVRCYAQGLQLVGDATTGVIAVMDNTIATEADGSAIRRLRRGPPLINENRRMKLGRFEVLLEVGRGLVTGLGSDPQVMYRQSGDGGQTWSNERTADAGRIGEYRRRVIFGRLGAPRMWVPEIVMTDPVPWRIVDGFLNNQAAA